ncbi:hypothetical protein PLANPX_4624 [Lacipirellula parvula]|uniref:Uncharacterized protein n=1 Tax=Lacipirellula parvula TaxID=2650471 RepID=A0A5K7XG65_9BACT|nr:hypothetical protein PLANPX_4624 [Lacipirellula parvula]
MLWVSFALDNEDQALLEAVEASRRVYSCGHQIDRLLCSSICLCSSSPDSFASQLFESVR